MSGAAAARKPAQPAAAQRDAIVFVSDVESRDVIAQALRDANLPGAKIVEGGISAALKQTELMPRFLMVDVSTSATPVQDVAALAAVMEPGTKLIVIGSANDVALYRDLLGVGASDYLVKPLDALLLHAALTEGAAGGKAGQAPAKLGRVIAFVGARGGVGSTTMAVNTAFLLAHDRKQRTALVDLDLHFGTAALSLDIEPGRGLRDALEKPGRIDSLFLERAMAKIGDRLFVLGCEEPLRDHPTVDPAAIDVVLGDLRQNFSWVVLDMPRAFVASQTNAFAMVTDLMLVCDQSMAGIRDTMRFLDFIKEAAPQMRLKLAAAAPDGSRPKIARAEFEKSIARKLDYEIPFEAKTVAAAANSGKPLSAVGRSGKLVKTLRQIASDLAGAEGKKAESAATGFLSRWIRK